MSFYAGGARRYPATGPVGIGMQAAPGDHHDQDSAADHHLQREHHDHDWDRRSRWKPHDLGDVRTVQSLGTGARKQVAPEIVQAALKQARAEHSATSTCQSVQVSASSTVK